MSHEQSKSKIFKYSTVFNSRDRHKKHERPTFTYLTTRLTIHLPENRLKNYNNTVTP